MKRILLSIPHMGGMEQVYADEAFSSNWVSTVGPNLTAFEEAFSKRIGMPSVALASGTAAIHLGLRLLGVGPGDEVFCSDSDIRGVGEPDSVSGRGAGVYRQRLRDVEHGRGAAGRRAQGAGAREQAAAGHRGGASLRPVRGHGSDPRSGAGVRRASSRRRGGSAGRDL